MYGESIVRDKRKREMHIRSFFRKEKHLRKLAFHSLILLSLLFDRSIYRSRPKEISSIRIIHFYSEISRNFTYASRILLSFERALSYRVRKKEKKKTPRSLGPDIFRFFLLFLHFSFSFFLSFKNASRSSRGLATPLATPSFYVALRKV